MRSALFSGATVLGMPRVYPPLTRQSIHHRPVFEWSRYASDVERWSVSEQQEFGERLKAARTSKGMTLADVGELFDTSKQTVHAWEKGRNMPTAEHVAVMAATYGEPVEWLLYGRRPRVEALSPDEWQMIAYMRALPVEDRAELVTYADNMQPLNRGSGLSSATTASPAPTVAR